MFHMVSIPLPIPNLTFCCTDLIAAALLCLIFLRLLYRAGHSHRHRHRLPPGPRGYPLVGALPLLGDMPHVALATMAKKYGPVMYLKVGTWGMAVASSPDSARAFLKTLDTSFSNRPPNAGATLLAYGAQDMVFAPYGPKWRLLRKISNLHMLGGKALEGWAHVRSLEVGHMLHAMHLACHRGDAISLPEMLIYATANMIGQVIFSQRVFGSNSGKEKEAVNEFKDMVVELMTTAGYFNIGDFIPCLAWMDLQEIEKGMKLLHKKFDRLITRMMDDHLVSAGKRSDKPDFLDILMALNRNNDHSPGEPSLTTTSIKALLLNLLTAGTDTSSSIIEWALAEMMLNPGIQKRAHEEMDRVIGRNRRLTESDLPKLKYLKAICKEAYRKHPSTPLNLPRISSEACVVNGYHIPKNTRLSVNIWAIGRDPYVWDNPLEFNPERFLSGKNAKLDPMGNDFELIPFGAGRRICAGARMGSIIVEYVLGTLVQAFEWRMPHEEKEMNMEEIFGLALRKAVPLTARLTPRLPPHNYRSAT